MFGTEHISKNIPCMDCGYNLRSLGPDGCCPECGRAIAESLRAERLLFADRRWLETIHAGATRVAMSCAGLLIPLLFWTVIMILGLAKGTGLGILGARTGATRVLVGAVNLWTLVCEISLVIGSWRITAPEPADPKGATNSFARLMPRLGTLIILSSILYALLSRALGLSTYLALFGVLLVIVGCCAHLSNLFIRIPNQIAVRRLRLRAWFLSVSGIGWLVLLGAQFVLSFGKAWLYVRFLALAITGVLAYSALLAALVELVRCRKPLKDVVAAANQLVELPDT